MEEIRMKMVEKVNAFENYFVMDNFFNKTMLILFR